MSQPSEEASDHLSSAWGSVGQQPGVGGLGPGFEGGGSALPEVPPAGEHPASVPETQETSIGKSLVYSSGNLGSGAWYALNNFILPLFLGPLGMPVPLIGMIGSALPIRFFVGGCGADTPRPGVGAAGGAQG